MDTTIQILAAQSDQALRQRLKAAAVAAGTPNADYWVDANIGALVTTQFPVSSATRTLTTLWAVAVREELSGWLKRLGTEAGVTITAGGDIEYYAATVAAWQVGHAESPGALVDLYHQAAPGREPGWSSRITDAHLTAAIAAVRAAPAT